MAATSELLASTIEQPPPPKAKKKKKKTANTKPTKHEDAYAPTKIAVKPGRLSVQLDSKNSQPATSGSTRNLVQEPEGGYSTGYYRVLLETKRVEMLCRSLSLQYRHVELLQRLFQSEDEYNTGQVTIDEFFHAINDEKRPLTLGMFPYVGLDKHIKRLTFDQFVLCIATFAALSRKELLHYAFTLFDADESGIMDLNELKTFCGNLKNKNAFYFQKNIDIAQKKLAEKDHTGSGAHHHAAGGGADGLVDFEDLQEGSEHFQVAFFPLMQFQQKIRAAALGEAFWADVVFRKAQIERIVHYMRLHNGHLPPLAVSRRLTAVAQYLAYVLTGGGRATTVFQGGVYALRKAAITKYAEELRIKQEQDAAARREEVVEAERQKQLAEATASEPAGSTQVEAFTVEATLDPNPNPNPVVSPDPAKSKKKKKKKTTVVADG